MHGASACFSVIGFHMPPGALFTHLGKEGARQYFFVSVWMEQLLIPEKNRL